MDVRSNSKIPKDSRLLRIDFLNLVLSSGEAASQFTLKVMRHAMGVVHNMLKEWGNGNADDFSSLLRMLLHREEVPPWKAAVAFLDALAPILHGNFASLDLTGIFETV